MTLVGLWRRTVFGKQCNGRSVVATSLSGFGGNEILFLTAYLRLQINYARSLVNDSKGTMDDLPPHKA
jgi:hypothetical protein